MTTIFTLAAVLAGVLGLAVELTARRPVLAAAGAAVITGVFALFAGVTALSGYDEVALMLLAFAVLNGFQRSRLSREQIVFNRQYRMIDKLFLKCKGIR